MAQVDAKLLQIMPKLQISLDKGKVTFNNKNKQKRFRLINFPRAASLDFMTSLRCLYCWTAEVLLFETIGQRSDVMKSKMAVHEKFKTRNLFRLLLLLNVTFPLSSKICNLGIIWSNLGSTRASSRFVMTPSLTTQGNGYSAAKTMTEKVVATLGANRQKNHAVTNVFSAFLIPVGIDCCSVKVLMQDPNIIWIVDFFKKGTKRLWDFQLN